MAETEKELLERAMAERAGVPPQRPSFDPEQFRAQAAAEGYDTGRASDRVAPADLSNAGTANAHSAPGDRPGLSFEKYPDNIPRAPEPGSAQARRDSEYSAAEQEVDTTRMEPRVPANYDATSDLQARTSQPQRVAMTPGGFQPERVTTQQEQGIPVPEDVRRLTASGYEARQASAQLQRDAGANAANAQGIAAPYAAEADRKFLAGELNDRATESRERGSALERIKAAVAEYDQPIESPHDRMQKWDAGKKIAFVLASAIGGAMGYKNASNPFLESFNKFADMDMEAMKQESARRDKKLGAANNLYDAVRQNASSDAEARAIVRALYWKSFASTVEQTAAKMGVDLNDAKYADMKASIDEKYRDALMEQGKMSGTKTTMQKSVKYVPPQFVTLAAKSTGMKPEDANKVIGEYVDYREKQGQPLREHVLNLAKNALEHAEPGAKQYILHKLASSPQMTLGGVLRDMAASGDPMAQKYLASVSGAFSKYARTQGGKAFTGMEMQLEQMQNQPTMFVDWYNNVADEYNAVEGEARLKLGVQGPQLMPTIDRLLDYHRNAPGTSARPIGADVMTGAIPKPNYDR